MSVQPDDGNGTLALSASRSQLPAGGGSVSFELTTSDGSTPPDISWQYVEDPPAQPAPVAAPVHAAQRAAGTLRAAAARGDVFTVDSAGRLVRGRPIRGGLILLRRTAASSGAGDRPKASEPRVPVQRGAASAPATDACTELMSCAVTITSTGAMVARATVGGRQLSASARVTVGGGGGAPELRLSCPASVERGQPVVCTTRAEPDTAALTITGWIFRPDDAQLPVITRTDHSSDTAWTGPLVTAGSVEVQARVDNEPKAEARHINVIPRDWSSRIVEADITEDSPGRLLELPTDGGQLGLTDLGMNFTAAGVAVIPEGPNAGLIYFTEIPIRGRITVHINTVALAAGSAFLDLQYPQRRVVNDTTYCGRAEVAAIEPMVRAHEGLRRDAPNSHVQIYMDQLDQTAPMAFETLVAQQTYDPAALVTRLHRAAAAESRKLDTSASNPYHMTCHIRFSSSATPPGR